MSVIEKVARAIAEGIGDNFDHAFASKSAWITARGDSGGRYRDVNEPRQSDYIDAARAALEALREPSEAMVDAICDELGRNAPSSARAAWFSAITAALNEPGRG